VHSKDDLTKKVKMLRLMGQKTGVCFQRCAGLDAMNAVYSGTYDTDQKHGTEYHKRFRNFLTRVQQEDLVVDAAMTDTKGDRSLAPGQQADPDLYLHIVEERKDGIVVRGAKAHQTGSLNSHEVLVMPTAAIKEEDKQYAVMFAVPSDTEGIIYIYGRQPSDLRSMDDEDGARIDKGNPKYGGQETLIVFDDVFVPGDLIFMMYECEFVGPLVERFACYHRMSYGGCKVGVGDTIIGATASIAEYNGTEKVSHIKEKIVEMTYLNELMYAAGLSAASDAAPLARGAYWVEPTLANVCKLSVTEMPFRIARLAQDIAGGAMVTIPSGRDLLNPEVGHLVEKYFKGVAEVPTLNRLKVLRYLENACLGRGALAYLTESVHGAGSPQAQRVMIRRFSNIEHKKRLVRDIVEID
jgi:4-hydroxybutyryl-CoA dehydratase/vinylacetyl-CoA-Delta-isomerase